MLEIEMKFPVADLAALETRLGQAGAGTATDRRAPDRDFARTDEALRVRTIGAANFVTYKGPKRDLQTKTRTELEVPLTDGPAAADAFKQLLRHLGYRDVAQVRKRRRVYHLERSG